MTADEHLALIDSIDRLYEQVVMDPGSVGEPEFADWAQETLGPVAGDKPVAREVRRALRIAQKLQAYWAERPGPGPADWRSRVDEKAGTRAWEPGLTIARLGLEHDPTPDLFDEVKRRIADVRFDRWMEGVGFEEWMEDRRSP